jgi:hypothetical protein
LGSGRISRWRSADGANDPVRHLVALTAMVMCWRDKGPRQG